MSHARAADPRVTIAEFDAFVAAQPDDGTIWELVDGHILGMTNPNAGHGQIALNMGAALKSVAEALGCRVNLGGMRVQSSADQDGLNKPIPDITVRCGPWSRGATWISDPKVVIEVLSPSTMDFERGAKLGFYKSLPAVEDIVIVYQDQVRIEHYRRDGDN